MGVTVTTVRVAANTGTGTQDITTTDLGGLTPKAVLLIATRCVTDGTAADGAGMYYGAADGTNEWAQGYEEQHAQGSMNSAEEQDTTANRILTIYDGTAADVVEGTANFDGFITNGVRIDWTDAPASAFLITAIFFAGSDLSVNVGTQTLGNTSDALIAITSVGFEADVVITTILEGTSTQNPGWGLGFVHNDRAGAVTQRSVGIKNRDGNTTSFAGAMMRDGECLTKLLNTDALDWFGAAQSFDSSGFDIQLGNARPPGNHHIGWLALRFGSSPVVSSKVYHYSTPTGTGSNTDSGAGFEPQFVMYLPNRAAAVDTLESDTDGGAIGVAVVDADETYTNSIGSEDAAGTSNTQSLSDDKINLPTHTGAAGQEATFTSFGGTGVTWNWTAVDGTARLWPALAIEVFSAGQTVTVNQVTETDTAQAITRQKIKAVGQVTETDTAQAITRIKNQAVSQASETDSAQAIVKVKRATLAQVLETDLAQPISQGQTIVPVGQVTETDSAQALTARKIRAVAQNSETDIAQALFPLKRLSIAQAVEVDLAQSLRPAKVKAIGQASETDAPQSIQVQKLRVVGQVSETDLAQAMSHMKRQAVSQVFETDQALAIAFGGAVFLGDAQLSDYLVHVAGLSNQRTHVASVTNLLREDAEVEMEP